MSQGTAAPRNRLATETSPYLLQHASNPVDWFPWGEEALQLARTEDRPILLSIGYSACHWCHVMERESFENEETADLMNRLFVNIKVDREERPDLDSIYMNYVQMTTGSGGWPLTVFLTPAGIPYYGGTYFPPVDHYGRPGFPRVLKSAAAAYAEKRADIESMAPQIVERLQQSGQFEMPPGEITPDLLKEAVRRIERSFDPSHGGFGGAPKFPQAMVLRFLLRWYQRSGEKGVLEMVTLSLDQMAQGGIYDQLGGGFHRYSVDERWLVPHFEKMLYDNALLSSTYLEAYQVTGSPLYRRVVTETLDFILREMTDEGGGFYSALDADTDGEEGLFYVWSRKEIEDILGDRAAAFCDYFDVSESGNFEGANILHPRMKIEKLAERLGDSATHLEETFQKARQALLQRRETRSRPGLDDKVLACWNGLTLASFASAGFVLGESRYLEAAARNAEFLLREMIREDRVARTWKRGESRLNGYLEDYAALSSGFITLFEASGNTTWLELAGKLMEKTIEIFGDDDSGSFFFTPHDHEKLIVRQKEHLDNATPSGNSLTCLNLLRLSHLMDRPQFHELGRRQLHGMSSVLARHPLAFGKWLQALDFEIGPVTETVVLGHQGLQDPLLAVLRKRFLPSQVVVATSASEAAQDLARVAPIVRGKKAQPQGTTAYVCQGETCSPPVTTADEMDLLLTSPPQSSR